MCRQSHTERVAVVRAAQNEMGIPERDRLPADGAILPAGFELPRLALSIPLFISAALVAITALIDLAKMASGMPENVADHHPES